MSNAVKPTRSVTVPAFVAAKEQGRPLAMLTAYDFPWAGIFDRAGVDAILVGDSLGMVVQGKSSTVPVTLDEMIYHAELVTRAVRRALVIVDLPFMSFQLGSQQAVENGGRIIKETGAAAVKLEGGCAQAKTIEALALADIPVMGHVGMRPQSFQKLGGMGRIQRDREVLLADAKAVEQAGAFGVVLELIPREIAAEITAELSIPTIGIGAGPDCDGQVLVSHDMLGITADFKPKFLKRYAELGQLAESAAAEYVQEVRERKFPDDAHSH